MVDGTRRHNIKDALLSIGGSAVLVGAVGLVAAPAFTGESGYDREARIIREFGLLGDVQLFDIRNIPLMDNAPGGFVIYEKEVVTPEPFSQTKDVEMLRFAWTSEGKDVDPIISEIPLDKVDFIPLDNDLVDPFIHFHFDPQARDRKNPNDYLANQLTSAEFYLGPKAARDFRADQEIYKAQ